MGRWRFQGGGGVNPATSTEKGLAQVGGKPEEGPEGVEEGEPRGH